MEAETRRNLPKFSVSVELIADKQTNRWSYEGFPPGELMDIYEKVVGNGLARVSVGADMAIKDFGTGVSAMVSVSLSCNQDQSTIEEAIRLAGNLARTYAVEQRQEAEAELKLLMANNNGR